MANINSFFNNVWGYTKDATAYCTGSANQYVWLRTLHFLPNFAMNGSVPYWHYFKTAFANDKPAGYFGHNALAGKKVDDCGIGHSNGRTFISFSFYDLPKVKYVVYLDNKQLRLEEKSSTFAINAEKEKAIYNYKAAIERAMNSLNKVNAKIAVLKNKNRTKAEQKQYDILTITYAQGIDKLKNLDGVNLGVQPGQTSVDGLGVLPAIAVVVGIVVVGILLWKLEAIYMESKLADNIAKNLEIQSKLSDDIKAVIDNPNLSAEEKQGMVDNITKHGIEPISKQREELAAALKKEQDSGDIMGTMKTLLMWGVGGLVLIKGIDLVSENLKSKKMATAA
jgi:hypothetical protein